MKAKVLAVCTVVSGAVYSEAGDVKVDVERAVRALKSDVAVSILRRAFEDTGVLPSTIGAPGRGANSLADSVAAEPAESFESIRFRAAYESALGMLEQEHLRRLRHASILLALFSFGALATVTLTVVGLLGVGGGGRGGGGGGPAMHVGVLAGAMLSGALGVWQRYAVRIAGRVSADLRMLAWAQLRRP
jgi:hypothetical protein